MNFTSMHEIREEAPLSHSQHRHVSPSTHLPASPATMAKGTRAGIPHFSPQHVFLVSLSFLWIAFPGLWQLVLLSPRLLKSSS